MNESETQQLLRLTQLVQAVKQGNL